MGPAWSARYSSVSRPRRRSPGRTGCRSIPVNHLHGHVASLYLQPEPVEPPFLCLLASGGHTLLIDVPEHGAFGCSGRRSTTLRARRSTKARACSASATRAGAAIDRLARRRRSRRVRLPRRARARARLLLLGVKTALLYAVRDLSDPELERRRADLAASYQRAIVRALVARAHEAAEQTGAPRIAVVGGVAANSELRAALAGGRLLRRSPLCTDNAAMIASAALIRRGSPLPELSCARCVRLAGSLRCPGRPMRRSSSSPSARWHSSSGPAGPCRPSRRSRSTAAAWRGLAGSARPQVDVGQRQIVVLEGTVARSARCGAPAATRTDSAGAAVDDRRARSCNSRFWGRSRNTGSRCVVDY